MARREEWIKKSEGSKKLSGILTEVTKPAFDRLGFVNGQLISKWREIVGDDIAAETFPNKVVFQKEAKDNGILHMHVNSESAIRIQYLEPVIIEKIAVYFGYKAISRIKIFQKS